MSNMKELKEKVENFKVLFVDDEKDIRDGMSVFLNKFFNDVTVCVDGLEGFETFKKTKDFDIVITDIMMPKMDGIEMMSKIKEIKSEIFTVFVTASRGDREVNDVDDIYLKKPISYEEIVSIMEIVAKTL